MNRENASKQTNKKIKAATTPTTPKRKINCKKKLFFIFENVCRDDGIAYSIRFDSIRSDSAKTYSGKIKRMPSRE